jgi:DNA polymerase III alpha subunit (gram-positive type)
MGRRKEAMKQKYEELKRAARRDTHIEDQKKTGVDTIEVVYEFVYRGTCITKHRDELKYMI